MHTEFIADIYAKHNVIELFKPFNDEIENYFKVKRDEMSAFALCVDMPGEDEFSISCGYYGQPAVADSSPPAVAANSSPAVDTISLPAVAANSSPTVATISLPAVAVSPPPGEQVSTQLGSVKIGKPQHPPSSHKFKRSKFNSKNKFSYNFKKQVQNFIPHCRFCVVDGHSSIDCTLYVTYQQRFDRCEELELCVQCTNPNHVAGPLCPGSKTGSGGLYKICKYCNSSRHVAALCEIKKPTTSANVCLSSHGEQEANFLLPVVSFKFQSRSGRVVVFNALFDTGSSRSYLNTRVAKLLEVGSLGKQVDYKVSNFLGCGTKKLEETCLVAHLPSGRFLNMPMLIDPLFNLDHEVRGLQHINQNLKSLNYNLSADFSTDSNKVQIDGLLGMDIIQFIDFYTIPCMHGHAIFMSGKVVPFGNSSHFLYPGQVGDFANSNYVENNRSNLTSYIKNSDLIVNVCCEPKVFSNALPFELSPVQNKIENLVNLDPLAVNKPFDLNSYSQEKILQYDPYMAGQAEREIIKDEKCRSNYIFMLKCLFLYFTVFAFMFGKICFHASRHFLLCLALLAIMAGSICLRTSQQLLACLTTLACFCLVVVFAMSRVFTSCINDCISAVSVWKEKVVETPLYFKVTSLMSECNLINFDLFYNQVIKKYFCVFGNFCKHFWLFHKPVFKKRELSKLYFNFQSCSVCYDLFKFIFCIKSGCKYYVGTFVNSLLVLYYHSLIYLW